MRKTGVFVVCVWMVGVALALSGCETYGGSAGAGALIGAGVGAVIGHQSGHAGEGALIGAAVGGLTGIVAKDIQVKRQRSRAETAAEYNYEPAQGEMLTFEHARVQPSPVARGHMAEGTIEYALLGTGSNGVQVRETRTLKRGNEVIAEISSKSFTRTDGTWASSQQFRIGRDLAPGEYVLVQKIATAESAISGSAKFVVN